MFVIGKGVIDDHYRALDKERAELEAMEEQKKIEYRMQNRELEIRGELSLASAGHPDIPPMPMDTPEYEIPYDEEWDRMIEDSDD